MSKIITTAVFALIVITCAVPASAQYKCNTVPTFAQYLADQSENDTIDRFDGLYAGQPTDTTVRRQKPTAALFKSLFVPGWGQIGNKKYVKAGIVIALESYLIVSLIDKINKTSDARDRFDGAIDEADKLRLYNEYRNAKDNRNLFSWYTVTVVFLSMFDAFVDAHLADFPEYDKKLAVDISSDPNRDIGITLSCKF